MAVELASTTLASDANLKAYYKLEDTSDSSGNGKTLTNNNSATFVAAKFNNGVSGGASDANKSLTIADALSYNGGDYSVSMWVKLNTEITSGVYYFSEIADAVSNSRILLEYDYNAGTQYINLQRIRDGVAADGGTPYTITMGTANFYNLVWTRNGTTIKLYVNNVERMSFTSSGNGSGGGVTKFSILEGRVLNDASTLGIIDDVACFNRALTVADIDLIYNGPPGGQFIVNFI